MAHSTLCRAQDAQALFDEGLSDMKAGRLKLGCAMIKRSLDLDARAGTLFTLAECYSRAGKSASAVEMYDRFLAVYEAMPPDQRAQQEARAELSRGERTRLVSQVAWLTVLVPDSAPPGVVVTRDGEPFNPGLFGVATAVDPGTHVFTARVPDGPLTEERMEIAPGERRNMILTIRTAEGAVPIPKEVGPVGTPDDGGQSHAVTPWFWVAGGIGVAGLATGAVTGAILLSDAATIKGDCPGARDADGNILCRTQKAVDDAKRAQRTLAPATTVALSVGAVGVAVAVILLLTDDHSHASSARTLPVVDVGSSGASFGLRSTF
jgi:hypothetical protein